MTLNDHVKRIQIKLSPYIDKNSGGLLDSSTSLDRLLDCMKGEIELDGKLYELSILASSTTSDRCLPEFISKGGVAILV